MSSKGINISIMGRDFSVACSEDEQENLHSAARYLDNSMQEIQKSGKILGSERVAIMAALNITNDLLKLQRATAGQEQIHERLESLSERIDEVLQDDTENL